MSASEGTGFTKGARTPGPWIRDDPNTDLIAGRDAEGHYDYVCQLWLDEHEGCGNTPERAAAKLEANAALILAAPDLAEALQNLKRAVAEEVILHGAGCTRKYVEAERAAAAALAKAGL